MRTIYWHSSSSGELAFLTLVVQEVKLNTDSVSWLWKANPTSFFWSSLWGIWCRINWGITTIFVILSRWVGFQSKLIVLFGDWSWIEFVWLVIWWIKEWVWPLHCLSSVQQGRWERWPSIFQMWLLYSYLELVFSLDFGVISCIPFLVTG